MDDISQLLEADRRYLVHPLHYPDDHKQPLVVAEGRGAMLYDAEGREYIDGLSGLWNVNVGHGRAELAEAASAQMRRIAFASAISVRRTSRPSGSPRRSSAMPTPIPPPPILRQRVPNPTSPRSNSRVITGRSKTSPKRPRSSRAFMPITA